MAETEQPQPPTCPSCGQPDRVEHVPPATPMAQQASAANPLADWWCSRCSGWLSALPAIPAERLATEDTDHA